jgi:hypothetical protein
VSAPSWRFEDAERFARLRALQASPEQRLEWLDAALEIARASGAWARERARRDAEMRRAWDLGAADRPR